MIVTQKLQAFRREDEDRPPAARVLVERVVRAADARGLLRARRRQRAEEVHADAEGAAAHRGAPAALDGGLAVGRGEGEDEGVRRSEGGLSGRTGHSFWIRKEMEVFSMPFERHYCETVNSSKRQR